MYQSWSSSYTYSNYGEGEPNINYEVEFNDGSNDYKAGVRKSDKTESFFKSKTDLKTNKTKKMLGKSQKGGKWNVREESEDGKVQDREAEYNEFSNFMKSQVHSTPNLFTRRFSNLLDDSWPSSYLWDRPRRSVSLLEDPFFTKNSISVPENSSLTESSNGNSLFNDDFFKT